MNNNLGNPLHSSTTQTSTPSPAIPLSLEESIRAMTPNQLRDLMRGLSASDLQRLEVEVLKTVKDKNIIKQFLDRKIELLKEKTTLKQPKPKKASFQVSISTVDSIAKLISNQALKTLNKELISELAKLDEQKRESIFNQMSQAQLAACLERILHSQEEGADEISEQLKKRLHPKINLNSPEIKGQLFGIQNIVRELIHKLDAGKIPLKERVTKQPPTQSFLRRIKSALVSVWQSIVEFFTFGEAHPKAFLKGRVKPLFRGKEPNWTEMATEKVLSVMPLPSPKLDSTIEKLRQEGREGLQSLREDENISAEEIKERKAQLIHHLLGMTITNLVATRSEENVATGGTFDKGGHSILSTKLEMQALEEILGKKDPIQREKLKKEYHFSEEDIQKLEDYYQGLVRGSEINEALGGIKGNSEDATAIAEAVEELGFTPGKLTPEQKAQVKDHVSPRLDKIDAERSKDIRAVAQKLVLNCHHLKPSESMFLDFSHYKHGMRITIQKTEDHQFVIKLHDNSGGIENTLQAASGIIGKIKMFSRFHDPRKMSLQFTVPENKLYAQGEAYFSGLFSRCAGKEYRIDEEVADRDAIKNQMSPWQLNWAKLAFDKMREGKRGFWQLGLKAWLGDKIGQYFAAMPRRQKWEKTIEAFGALAPDKVEFVPSLRTPAESKICYAQRMQTNQLDAFGERLYTKFGRFISEWSLKKILNDAEKAGVLTKKEVQEILSQDKIILTPQELTQISDALAPIKGMTEGTHDKKAAFQNVAKLISHNIQKLKVNRRIVLQENDPSLLSKANTSEAIKANPSIDDLEDITLVNRFEPGRVKVRKIEIYLKGVRKEIDSSTYLELLKQKPQALAKPAVIESLLYIYMKIAIFLLQLKPCFQKSSNCKNRLLKSSKWH